MTDIRAAFASMQNGSAGGGGSKASKASSSGTIEKTYQKKSQLEHILLRPDTYIGSVEMVKESMWVFDSTESKMVQREISYVPGLYKIFDEILVNAADNKQRDSKMNCIKIEVNQETNTISVWNNGQGIPVVMHKEEKMYVPTMIFGHLLTSSNYNDEEQKVTGGRNGYGAKLCNIFSTTFTVETSSKIYKKSFKQTWGENMKKASEPKIKDNTSEDFTKITFSPDLSKFKMDKLDDDIVSLINRRAYDVAASTRGVSVFLNGSKIPVKTFKDYIDLYLKGNMDDSGVAPKVIYENVNERWEVALTMSDRGFQQVSFVNSIATTKGGRHVDHVVDSIVKQLIEILKKKNKGGTAIKPFQVKNHIWVFINCLIVNPTFDSQTKENMTLQAKSFGSKCSLSEKFITSVTKCGVVESILSWAKFKAQNDLAKTSGKKNSKIKGVPKLEDANEAGTKNAHLCTLILTEGDSAKSLAVSGLGVVGRDHYGVFPLRGKLLNVREATHKQILENAEINSLIKIIGLQYKKKYLSLDDLKTLRYGKVMIMTDQDQDGSHIKGLVINFIHTNWPELLRLPFLEEFITPIVKATKKNEELSFYSLPEFEEWKADTPNSHTYNVKYYKGLGTSTSKEAKEYFTNMERHRIVFKYDGTADDDAIVMAFAKKCVDNRKDWLTQHMDDCKRRKLLGLPDRYLYTKTTKQVSYSEFVNLELVLFSNADNERSIPSMIDGFKPGQRKVMFTCFKRNDKREVKVAQLAGSVAEKSAYHHGETSLCGTIVNLAQNYVGSNNINLLIPNGQFGTRLCGGKDSASPRYIFTMMSPLTRLIFHPHDDKLLQYQKDDNLKIEPVWYIPIIPMVLVNGAEGIGTGWSTKIPNYNPRDLISALRLMIQGETPKSLHPWYKNYKGTIDCILDQKYLANGNVSILSDNKIEITELPVGTWTQNYKENVLEPLLHGSDKVKALISDYKEYNTDTTVRFVVTFAPGEMDRIRCEEGGFHRVFKLTSSISTTSMHAFDSNICLRRYENVNYILKEFFELRLEFYHKRKAYMEGMLGAEADRLSNQARFILEKCDKTLVVENKKRKIMIDELIKRGYQADPILDWRRKMESEALEDEEQDQDDDEEEEDTGASTSAKAGKVKKEVDPEKAFKRLTDVKNYDYLLGMSMWMLTEEKKNELLKQRDNKLSELNILKSKTAEMLWLADLDALSTKLDEVEENERNEELGINKKQAKALAKAKATTGRGARRSNDQGNEIFPARNGIKVEFKVTNEVLKKYEKIVATAAAVKKERGVKKEKVGGGEPDDEIDEVDALIEGKPPKSVAGAVTKGRKPKAEKSTAKVKVEKADNLKQTKLDFVQKKTKKKSDSENEFDGISDDVEFISSVPAREKPSTRRAASKKIVYAFDDDDDEDKSDNNEEIFDQNMDEDDSTAKQKVYVLESDSEPEQNNVSSNVSNDDMFNSLKISDSSDAPKKEVKRILGPKAAQPAKAATGGTKRPRKKKDESSDEELTTKKTKKKKIFVSDDDFSPIKKSSRPNKRVINDTYRSDSDSDSDF